MSHECDKCGRVFKYKSKLLEHKNRKKPCKPPQNVPPTPQNVPPNDNKSCAICGKEFTRASNKKRHELICKGHDSKTCKYCEKSFASHKGRWKHENDRPNSCYKIENIKLKANMAEQSNNNTVNNNINITLNTVNNNTNINTINMIPYDQEKYECINEENFAQICDAVPDINKILRSLTETGHNNNRNAKITNLRSNTALIYNGSKYIPVPIQELISECARKMNDRISEINIDKRHKFVQYTLNAYVEDEEEDDDFVRDKKMGMEAIKLGLYVGK